MPKSRGRKTRRNKRSTRSGSDPRRDLRAMQPYFAVMLAVNDAEARGDAAGALEIMDANLIGPDGDCFWKPWRMKRLMLITLLGAAMPGWMTSRWILEQAQFAMHEGVRAIHQRAESVAVELRGGWSAVEGVDPLDARGRVSDRDWVFRQLALYDYGGPRHFLRHQATPDLVVGADRIDEWAEAPMGGYALVDSDPVTTTWLDLHSGERYSGPNIGSAAMLDVGEHVIGRLVPTDEGSIFETQPLRVPESLARVVSERPTEWVELLRDVMAGPGWERHRDARLPLPVLRQRRAADRLADGDRGSERTWTA